MSVLYSGRGGTLVVPALPLLDRADGGHLIVNPPRDVWERSELSAEELSHWSAMVAAAGRAMLDALPQLQGGCINYWEAGNWSLHDAAEPAGPKSPGVHRRVHLHLLGRSPRASHPAWAWGEAPAFPRFVDRLAWASTFASLTPAECDAIVRHLKARLGMTHG
jgi:diadenosine tetraphosphate (Ap4A) HIT family hydrolase